MLAATLFQPRLNLPTTEENAVRPLVPMAAPPAKGLAALINARPSLPVTPPRPSCPPTFAIFEIFPTAPAPATTKPNTSKCKEFKPFTNPTLLKTVKRRRTRYQCTGHRLDFSNSVTSVSNVVTPLAALTTVSRSSALKKWRVTASAICCVRCELKAWVGDEV